MSNLVKFKNKIFARSFYSKLRRKIISRVWLVRSIYFSLFISALLLLFGIGIKILSHTDISYFLYWGKLAAFPEQNKLKVINGRVNVLLLGKGGDDHEGADLTDTILLVSMDVPNKALYLTNLPRDFWIEGLKTKINSLYYYGEQKEIGGGLSLAKNAISELTGIPIQYVATVDFDGFVKIVNSIGGIDVLIQNGFTDDKYPIAGKENDTCGTDKTYSCRYETVKFKSGMSHMDGATALKYVRSRHAEGDEGNDFSRNNRQREVAIAIKDKVFSKKYLFNPSATKDIIEIVDSSIERDFDDATAAALVRLVYDSKDRVVQYGLSKNDYQIVTNNPLYEYLYVLIPKNNDLNQLKASVKCGLGMCN